MSDLPAAGSAPDSRCSSETDPASRVDDSRFVHVVGLYKNGTSWLSHILCAHPQVIGWREFDIIRATHQEQPASLIRRIACRYRPARNMWPSLDRDFRFSVKQKEQVIRDMFCGRGWIPLMGKDVRDAAAALDYHDSGKFIDELMRMAGKTLGRDNRPLLQPHKFTGTLGYGNSTRRDLVSLLDNIKQVKEVSQVPHLFFEYLQKQCVPGTPIALKAADQVLCLPLLQQLSPRSRKIAVIRDGRDAAISAAHYGELMRKWDTPWIPKKRSFKSQLRSWAQRARILSDYADKNDIVIVRYEDIKRNFNGVVDALFTLLEIPVSQLQLQEIHRVTDFSTVTSGRRPGQAAEHIVRKGIIGEWTSVLSDRDARLAWRVAGEELTRFGYTRTGQYVDHPDAGILAAR